MDIEETVMEPTKEDRNKDDKESEENISDIENLLTGIIKQELPPHREESIIIQTRYVLGFALTPDKQKVLLITKNRPEWQAGLLNGIGGKIEMFDETPFHAMSREFEEETNILIAPNHWHAYATMESPHFKVCVFWTMADLDVLEKYVSVTDELVSLENIEHLFKTCFSSCISNLSWLIGMLIDRDLHKIHGEIKYA